MFIVPHSYEWQFDFRHLLGIKNIIFIDILNMATLSVCEMA